MPCGEQLRCKDIIIHLKNDKYNNNNKFNVHYKENEFQVVNNDDNPPSFPPESTPSIHSKILNDGERILLFTSVYQGELKAIQHKDLIGKLGTIEFFDYGNNDNDGHGRINDNTKLEWIVKRYRVDNYDVDDIDLEWIVKRY